MTFVGAASVAVGQQREGSGWRSDWGGGTLLGGRSFCEVTGREKTAAQEMQGPRGRLGKMRVEKKSQTRGREGKYKRKSG